MASGPALAADVTFATPELFQFNLQAITAEAGANTLTYNGAYSDLVVNAAVLAPGAGASLQINVAPSEFYVGKGAGQSGALTLGSQAVLNLAVSGGQIDAFLGADGGAGTLNVNGGAVNIGGSNGVDNGQNGLVLGYGAGSIGTLNITAGHVEHGAEPTANKYGQLYVGYAGQGAVSMSGGALRMLNGASVRFGLSGGSGTLNLSGDAEFVVTGSNTNVMFGYGANTTASITVSDNAEMRIVRTGAGDGYFYVGYRGGSATVTQNGAGSLVHLENAYNDEVVIAKGGSGARTTGVYNLQAGTLQVGVATKHENLVVGSGTNADGTFNVSGGQANITGNLDIARSTSDGLSGTVNLSGGVLSVGEKIRFGTNVGALNQSGGVLEIGGANAITGSGALSFSGGSVRATSDLSIAHAATLSNNGLTINSNGYAVTYSGVLSGAGGVTKTGAGTLTLSGANEHEGGVAVYGGLVDLQHASALGSGRATADGGGFKVSQGHLASGLTVGANGGSVDLAGRTVELGGVSTGAGDVTFTNGSVTLNGQLTWTGDTILGAGVSMTATGADQMSATSTLRLGAGAAFDAGAQQQTLGGLAGEGSVTAGGILSVGANNESTQFDGVISGEGGLTKVGSGTLTLTAAQQYEGATTVSSGVLALAGDGAFVSNGTFFIEGGALDLGGKEVNAGHVFMDAGELRNGDLAFEYLGISAGDVSANLFGSGEIVKSDRDTSATLSGDSSAFTGTVKVNAGQLVVNGDLSGGAVTVGVNGRLAGVGSVGGLVVNGVVAPGNSIGTLTANGDVTFAQGSTFEVEVNGAGQSDLLSATGEASIEGGIVRVLAAAGAYQNSTTYTILTAAEGVTGEFDGVSANFAFLTPSLQYDATSVTLQLDRNNSTFGDAATTRNELATAIAVERLGHGNPVYDAILFGSAESARLGFNMLSGEIHTAFTTTAVTEANITREAIFERLRNVHGAGQAARPAEPHALGAVFWGQGFGSWGDTKRSAGVASVERQSSGFIIGADTRFDDVTLGVAGGYVSSRFNMHERLSRGDTSTLYGSLYAATAFGPAQLSGGVSYAASRISTSRGVAFPGFSDQASAKYDAGVFQAFAEAGYRIAVSDALGVTPFVNAAAIRIHTDDFVERGGPAALMGRARTNVIGVATTGVRLSGRLATTEWGALSFNGMLGWRGAVGDVRPVALNAFRSGFAGAPFGIEGAPVDRSAAVLSAGLDWVVNPAVTLGVNYAGQYGARSTDQQFRGKADVRF